MKLLPPFSFRHRSRSCLLLLHHLPQRTLPLRNWISRPQHVEITEAAGGESLDPEEQNNINVYRKNIGSVVNITSRVMTFDFFYGPVPQEGQGSGFVIDKEGHILTNYHVIAERARSLRSRCTIARSTRPRSSAPTARTTSPSSRSRRPISSP